MSSKFLNLSVDTTLGGETPSDMTVSSQKAIKGYVDTSLNGKQDVLTAGSGIDITSDVISVDSVSLTEVTLATVATSGAYSDLTGAPSWTYDSSTETLTIG